MTNLSEIKITEKSNDHRTCDNSITIISCGSGDHEEIVIVTRGKGEDHEWIMQTTDGKFDSAAGCMEFMDGEEFDRDELTKTEESHYDVANDCFDETASKFCEENKAKELEEAGRYYYARSCGQMITEDIYEGGFLRYEKDSEPYCDLHRFDTERERDSYVDNTDSNTTAIRASEALKYHSEQMNHWKR